MPTQNVMIGWRRMMKGAATAVFLFIMMVLGGGCSDLSFVYSSTREIVSTPREYGLEYQELRLPVDEALYLHGWFVPGERQDLAVVYFHGNSANISHRLDNVAFLHEMGLSVLIFDYRGFGQSDGETRREDDIYIDGRAAISYLERMGWNVSRIILYGQSLGAAVAVQLATETRPAGVVLEGAFTSLKEMARRTRPVGYYTLGWLGIGNRFDNLSKIARITRPLLIVHGEQDEVVPAEMSVRLYERARPPKKLLLVPGAGHSNVPEVAREEYRRAWLYFIDNLE